MKPEIVRCATNIYIKQKRQNGERKMSRRDLEIWEDMVEE